MAPNIAGESQLAASRLGVRQGPEDVWLAGSRRSTLVASAVTVNKAVRLPEAPDTPTETAPNERYTPKPLEETPDAQFRALVQAAKQRRLVMYVGAGLSMAAPSCGPTGSAVAGRLRPHAARILGIDVAELQECALEELAERIAERAPQRLDELRERAAQVFDFRGMEPNFGHEIAALLLREGLIQLISVNWDCGVESAGMRADVRIEGVATPTQRLQLVQELPLYKVHGCATRPNTLALTQAEVDKPQRWAVAEVQSALTGGIVVFVGLGTVGLYVREPVAELVAIWAADAASVHVVDPELPNSWREALGDRAEEAHVAMSATEFLDDLLRAVVLDALDGVDQAIQVLVENEPWAANMGGGCHRLRAALASVPADAVLRWWRDGVIGTHAGSPFITELPGRRALMTVALLTSADPGPVEVRGVRGRLTVASPRQYFEIICRPGEHVRQVETIARDRIQRRREESVYSDDRMVTVVVSEAIGEFPAPGAPPDISAGNEVTSDIAAGIGATPIRLVADEVGVRGTLAA